MQRLVITTVGTSLLTNQIDRECENSDYDRLLETANYSDEEVLLYEDVVEIMGELKVRAETKLKGNIDDIRKACAELNGIYGLYNNDLKDAYSDYHLLIHTDTAQGRDCAKILMKFLTDKEIKNIEILCSENFSTASNDNFLIGISQLIPILKNKITQDYKGYTICFNLVGGFKAMQGYFNTIGMLYADEIIYIFEESTEILTIPKLPVQIDISQVEAHEVALAVMDVGKVPISWQVANQVPKDWVTRTGTELTLSIWGKLIWNECKDKLLSKDKLLNFPKFVSKLNYQKDYLQKDYENTTDTRIRIRLQEKLARAAYLLLKYRDGIAALKDDDILRLRKYEGVEIEHINITKKELRLSCEVINNDLYLRYFGTHEHIYKKEGMKK
ncbi:putative CRISPR-associated protein [Calothrix sp. UHCC 0171]|uniref:putative CRISPR-associated protein n=1 Tax=Calothrix sp. UHCC 0171 TaxID=3110245 RepID=UPI002B2217B9|nr:putative CRISPR-associated protein [Calothrix sp. UHCC 0171]MEA5573543.1 putative CRISPR-associated protein [Calothrix sp. UHCC 0171]